MAPSKIPAVLKLTVAAALLLSAVSTVTGSADVPADEVMGEAGASAAHRRLSSSSVGSAKPKYMDGLFKDLKARKKLFEDTPKEEIKYWFEYAGPLQVSKATRHGWMPGCWLIVLRACLCFALFFRAHEALACNELMLHAWASFSFLNLPVW